MIDLLIILFPWANNFMPFVDLEYHNDDGNKVCYKCESSSLVVMRRDSCSKGCEFESHHQILKGFFT